MSHIQKKTPQLLQEAGQQVAKTKHTANNPAIQAKQRPVQRKSSNTAYTSKEGQKPPIQAKQQTVQSNLEGSKNNKETQIKKNVGQLMGTDVSDAKVHYNSSKPAQLHAEATAQGNQVHLAPGKEKHLGHELTHVAQQKQGVVKPTMQANNGTSINNDPHLEKQADDIGAQALQMKSGNTDVGSDTRSTTQSNGTNASNSQPPPVQLYAAGTYITKEDANLRDDDKKEVTRALNQGEVIHVAHNARELKFTTGFIFGSKNHVWVTDSQGNSGWIRESAIGGRETTRLVDSYTQNAIQDTMRNVPRGGMRRGFIPPDVQRHQQSNPRIKNMVRGIDISQSATAVVTQLLNNIAQGSYFAYNGTHHSALNFLSGQNNGGDCRTLSESIRTIMVDIFGFGNINIKSKNNAFRVNNTKPLFDGTTPNRNDHWEFDNHYWLDVDGTEIDVLFNARLDKSDWVDE
ncbi:DUF4157 domain-containing protein [uncultured Microscilla sp.]|uniref:eCIS core domain-containing protein n=1 Tax=uncultured Microscilla sp. TaxID=432653 RepID=UPI002602A07D|nr:DUF4157 domain-containing protein [uncultured Microscilla sp.]